MTQEDKELLLTDLCARLPYDPIVYVDENLPRLKLGASTRVWEYIAVDKPCKPYLRQMSSMTEEERIEFSKLLVKRYCEEDWEGHISTSYCIEIDNVYTDDENGIKYPSVFSMDAIDWLNKHHFDYRGLIEKGLALAALEGMYK
jgi:hypothetical protein